MHLSAAAAAAIAGDCALQPSACSASEQYTLQKHSHNTYCTIASPSCMSRGGNVVTLLMRYFQSCCRVAVLKLCSDLPSGLLSKMIDVKLADCQPAKQMACKVRASFEATLQQE